jgi:hypothetical protein
MIKNDKSSVHEIKIQNISNNVSVLSTEIADEINNYLSTSCIDREELERLSSIAVVREQQSFSRDNKELIVKALLNSVNPENRHIIISDADITTLPALTYQISSNSYAVGRNYKAHDYSTMSIIHILPSIGEITKDVFENNKTTIQYVFYGSVKLTPNCFPVGQIMKNVSFNFTNMSKNETVKFVEENKDVKVFSVPTSNIKIITGSGSSSLAKKIKEIFNVNDN